MALVYDLLQGFAQTDIANWDAHRSIDLSATCAIPRTGNPAEEGTGRNRDYLDRSDRLLNVLGRPYGARLIDMFDAFDEQFIYALEPGVHPIKKIDDRLAFRNTNAQPHHALAPLLPLLLMQFRQLSLVTFSLGRAPPVT